MEIGDLVKDTEGFLGIVTGVYEAYDLYDQLLYPEAFEEEDFPMGYQLVSVFSFEEEVEMVFFDVELEVLSSFS